MKKSNSIILLFILLIANWQIDANYISDRPFTLRKPVYKASLMDENVYIKIFSQLKIQSFSLSSDIGNFQIFGDGKEIGSTSQYSILKFSYLNDSIEIKTYELNLGRYKHVMVSSRDSTQAFRLKLINPERKARFYEGYLQIDTEAKYLKLINEINLDKYIAGVVQAESGRRSHKEFYKVQAILARTFALSHLQKHVTEGFGLCDYTHCQVYFGKTSELDIIKAVHETTDKVVVDENLNLIDAAFHSNSGGQTVNSEEVWGTKLNYLRSVNDSFSTQMPNAKWERKMAKEDWLSYLKLKHNYPIEDSSANWLALNFKQENRKQYLEANRTKIPLKNIRTDLQLKSTFFSIYPHGDSLVFKGRGYGHGVGMCQEGAMNMTKLGYSYGDIINFYYQKTQLINLHQLHFFKDE